jgi:hypothetical protein
MIKTLLLSFVLSICGITYAGNQRASDTINKLNRSGEREGWWVLTKDNDQASGEQLKLKEGRYINGRKNGVWITYYEDGKTPRLIGEYSDNRPSGSYFRFDRKGELLQASAIPKSISMKQRVQVSNPVFSCRMFFNQRDVVAGQVFFTNRIFKKDLAVKFWVESSMKSVKTKSSLIDFTWLDANYTNILTTYTSIRTPKKMRVEQRRGVAESKPKVQRKRVSAAKVQNYYYPPMIKQPRVAKGMVFVPNGLNKLYTESSEIWIDGHFINGQLYSGKVFIYDHDGVLLKVRVYKEGVYDSDGVL